VLEWLNPTGAAVGLVEGLRLEESSIQPNPGDCLVLYTDGITEAMNQQGEQFGFERLANLVGQTANGSSSDLVRAIRENLMEFSAGQDLADDATLLVCHILR
jgi:sigma-B regulation protein RsbU (phosphoserine phosphatase)